jgi:hypothetical protein
VTVAGARDEFFRRYATSPIHVPRLERLLSAYGDDGEGDTFAGKFIAWDRACPDGEAARIVAEIISAADDSGRIVRVSDETLIGAIRWMTEATYHPVAERAAILAGALSLRDEGARRQFVEFLESVRLKPDTSY